MIRGPLAERSRQWLVAAIAVLAVLAGVVAWTSYLNARGAAHWRQTEPGAMADPLPEGGMPMRLASLTVTPMLTTDRGDQPAPAGALWVIAVIDYQPPPQGSHCGLVLLAADGRRWNPVGSLDYSGSRALPQGCGGTPGEGVPRGEQIYLIPADAAGTLAGLGHPVLGHRGTTAYPVLTPAS
ncbi:MAG: hypothetical protein QM582_07650 [Micropruina sp.]|uniref:hypothetical protein n=1 Tax=Micropruina sp. TaxID=2737536 RepID=UPI0039E22B85